MGQCRRLLGDIGKQPGLNDVVAIARAHIAREQRELRRRRRICDCLASLIDLTVIHSVRGAVVTGTGIAHLGFV